MKILAEIKFVNKVTPKMVADLWEEIWNGNVDSHRTPWEIVDKYTDPNRYTDINYLTDDLIKQGKLDQFYKELLQFKKEALLEIKFINQITEEMVFDLVDKINNISVNIETNVSNYIQDRKWEIVEKHAGKDAGGMGRCVTLIAKRGLLSQCYKDLLKLYDNHKNLLEIKFINRATPQMVYDLYCNLWDKIDSVILYKLLIKYGDHQSQSTKSALDRMSPENLALFYKELIQIKQKYNL